MEQIDEVLQTQLEKSPLKAKNIRLMEMYNKGVVVWVGSEYFEGIDGVPDEEVKQFIKACVKLWEQQKAG